MARIAIMTDIATTNALRLLQAGDRFRAQIAGEFSSIHGLSVGEFFLMLHLERAPLHRLSRVELAKRMHVSASTVTRMAAPMEKLGLLDRQPDERDARLAFVVLTETGRGRLGEAQATFAKRAERLFQDRWSDDEIETFGALLHRMMMGSPADLTG